MNADFLTFWLRLILLKKLCRNFIRSAQLSSVRRDGFVGYGTAGQLAKLWATAKGSVPLFPGRWPTRHPARA